MIEIADDGSGICAPTFRQGFVVFSTKRFTPKQADRVADKILASADDYTQVIVDALTVSGESEVQLIAPTEGPRIRPFECPVVVLPDLLVRMKSDGHALRFRASVAICRGYRPTKLWIKVVGEDCKLPSIPDCSRYATELAHRAIQAMIPLYDQAGSEFGVRCSGSPSYTLKLLAVTVDDPMVHRLFIDMCATPLRSTEFLWDAISTPHTIANRAYDVLTNSILQNTGNRIDLKNPQSPPKFFATEGLDFAGMGGIKLADGIGGGVAIALPLENGLSASHASERVSGAMVNTLADIVFSGRPDAATPC